MSSAFPKTAGLHSVRSLQTGHLCGSGDTWTSERSGSQRSLPRRVLWVAQVTALTRWIVVGAGHGRSAGKAATFSVHMSILATLVALSILATFR
jgi:hypothetical protein